MRKVLLSIVKAGFILVFAVLGFIIASKNPPPQVYAQQCTTPTQVQGVLITFPYCSASGQCQFTQAICNWSALSGAANYQVTITNSTSSTQVLSQSVTSSTTSMVFPVQDNNTYTCTVAAVNSCGTAGPTNSNSLLCDVDALVSSPTPAPATATPVPPTPIPTVPPAGAFETTIIVGLGALIFVVGGLALMIL